MMTRKMWHDYRDSEQAHPTKRLEAADWTGVSKLITEHFGRVEYMKDLLVAHARVQNKLAKKYDHAYMAQRGDIEAQEKIGQEYGTHDRDAPDS